MKKSQKPVVIATWKHGYKASMEAYRVINNNGNGYVTLDASIMNHLGNAGSVAYLRDIKHPISVARKVMEKSDHVMLVGLGAQKFALKNGFK